MVGLYEPKKVKGSGGDGCACVSVGVICVSHVPGTCLVLDLGSRGAFKAL